MEDLTGYLKREDQNVIQQKEQKHLKKKHDYVLKCENDGNRVVCIDTIPDWLSEKSGVNMNDVVEVCAESEKAIMIIKMKAPLFKKVVLFEVWLPKSQIDYSIVSSAQLFNELNQKFYDKRGIAEWD